MSKALAPLRHDPAAGYPVVEFAEGLTAGWLNNVLKARGLIAQSRVTGVVQTPVGNGLLGTNVRLQLSYDRPEAGAPASLVAKLAAVGEVSRDAGAGLQLYRRETRFYQEIAPLLKAGLPQTLFADISDDGRIFTLLFEDLAPARGGDQLAGCSVADAEAAMDAAAALHAPLWGDAELPALPWLNRKFMVGMYCEKFPPSVAMIKPRFAALLEPGAGEVLDRFAACIRPFFALHTAPWTITHQDFRLDNMLFDARGGALPVAVLDWQTLLPGPGVLDVSYFIGAGLLPEARRTHEQALMRRYHAALLDGGVRGYNWERCWHDYRLLAAHGTIMGVVGAAITTPTERGDRMLSTLINRHVRQMVELDTLSLIH